MATKYMAALASSIAASMAQGPGNGISKPTYAASNPTQTSYPWMMKHPPVTDAPDSPPGNIATCGAAGRVYLTGAGFGAHTVLAEGAYKCRSRASGNLTVADVEAIFDRKVTPAIKRGGRVGPWMDYNTGLYVSGLSMYTAPFKADNVPYMPIMLNDSHFGELYPAIYVHIPLTQAHPWQRSSAWGRGCPFLL